MMTKKILLTQEKNEPTHRAIKSHTLTTHHHLHKKGKEKKYNKKKRSHIEPPAYYSFSFITIFCVPRFRV